MEQSSSSEPSLDAPHNPPSIDSHIDIESATEALSDSSDWENIQNFARLVSLGGLGASVTLIVNMPSTAAAHRILYTAYMAAAFIRLFSSLVLAFYACRRRSSREMVQLLKSLMFFTLSFIVIACLLRLLFVLPFQYLGFELLCIFGAIILAALIFYIVLYYKRRGDTDVVVPRS